MEITSKLVSTSNVYFEWEIEYLSFFCPKLDFIKLDFLTVMYDSQLVDEDTMAPLEPKASAPAKEGVESRSPQQEDSIMKKAI